MPNPQFDDYPELGWLKSLFRKRNFLQYWLNGELQTAWVCNFYEKSERCIVYQDYVTKQATIVKSDHPIVYTLTETR